MAIVTDPIPIRILHREAELQAGAVPSDVEGFLEFLGIPSLIFVKGRDPHRSRAVVTLLHGNEPSGIRAVHAWLRSGRVPATNTLIFVAAVRTALQPPGFAHRFLPGHTDLNRCWLHPAEGNAGEFAREVLERIRTFQPESLIDLHNNTGHSPAYGVGPTAGRAELGLTSLFTNRFVRNDLRLGTLIEATSDEFTSVSIECGRAGADAADATALAGLERYLAVDDLSAAIAEAKPVALYGDPVRVCVRSRVELAFGEAAVDEADFTVARDIDRHNFERLEPGVQIGWLGRRNRWPIEATSKGGADISRELFASRDGVLETRREIVPIMMTTNRRNALDDCLFYVVRPGKAGGSET